MTAPAPTRRLYRSRTDRMLGGVAGGLARYLQLDPSLVRLAFVVLLFTGVGALAYIAAWIIIPEEPAGEPAYPASADAPPAADEPRPGGAGRGARLVIGAVLVIVGVAILLDWALPDLHRYFWPAAVILVGLGFLAYGARR